MKLYKVQLSNHLNSFSGILTQQQKDVVALFLNEPINWEMIKHGEKRKLGENISVVFIAAEGNNDYKNILEAHRKFYDLHFTASGNDIIVSKPVIACSSIKTEYNDEGDYILFNEEPGEVMNVPPEHFCLIPPSDAHMAMYGECGAVKKLVFKIPVN